MTYQQYHPGVTTMWVAGLGMELYRTSQGLPAGKLPSSTESGPQGAPAQAAVKAMTVVIAGSIALAYALLYLLTDWPVAITAGILLALDPFYITHSKMIHVDAFLATFMLVSVLAWLVYLKKNSLGFLLLSGIFTALALLTKSPAWYLVPFIGSLSVIDFLILQDQPRGESENFIMKKSPVWQLILSVGIWGLVFFDLFFLLFPAMWWAPRAVLLNIFRSVFYHASTTHLLPVFFAGKATLDDLGPFFYPATIAWKSTMITMPGIVAAVIFLIRRYRGGKEVRYLLYLVFYIAGFLLVMTIGSKKGGRYILPAIVALDILAAWGLVKLVRWIGDRKQLRSLKWLPAGLIIALLLVQAITVFRHHPYYGTHYNLLLGGTRVARRILQLGEQSEGMDLAAQFLNKLPGAADSEVAIQYDDLMFSSNYVGSTVDFSSPNPDYVLFYVLHDQRFPEEQRHDRLRETCQERDPLWSKSFGDVTYVWLCEADATEAE